MLIRVWNKETKSFEYKNFEFSDFDLVIQYFIDGCAMIKQKHNDQHNYKSEFTLTLESGSKYIRVVVADPHRSVYCFVDKTNGNILKSASWKAPAKHARGNIFSENNGLENMGPYGAAYLK